MGDAFTDRLNNEDPHYNFFPSQRNTPAPLPSGRAVPTNDHDLIMPLVGEAEGKPTQYTMPDDPTRESVTLADLAKQTRMPLDDLYGRANGRRLLISTSRRTPAGERRVFRDVIAQVLAPKRGERTLAASTLPDGSILSPACPATVTPPEPDPSVVIAQSQVTRALTRDHTVRKTILLVRQGHLTSDEAIVLIEGLLKD